MNNKKNFVLSLLLSISSIVLPIDPIFILTHETDPRCLVCLDVSPDGRYLITRSDNPTYGETPIKYWNLSELSINLGIKQKDPNKLAKKLKKFPLGAYEVRSIEITKDGKILIVGGDDSSITAWDTQSGKLICEIQSTESLTYEEDQKIRISACTYKIEKNVSEEFIHPTNPCHDNYAKLEDIGDDEEGFSHYVNDLKLSSDEKFLLAGHSGKVLVFNFEEIRQRTGL